MGNKNRRHIHTKIDAPYVGRIGTYMNFEVDDPIRQAFKAEEKLKKINHIISEYYNNYVENGDQFAWKAVHEITEVIKK